jgi:hypothetical protein
MIISPPHHSTILLRLLLPSRLGHRRFHGETVILRDPSLRLVTGVAHGPGHRPDREMCGARVIVDFAEIENESAAEDGRDTCGEADRNDPPDGLYKGT